VVDTRLATAADYTHRRQIGNGKNKTKLANLVQGFALGKNSHFGYGHAKAIFRFIAKNFT